MFQKTFYAAGLRFECTRCSRCCRHTPGYVFLSRKDIDALLAMLGAEKREFLHRYCRHVSYGTVKRISLKEKPNLDCIFWENDGCSVYDARPLQCRSFPFWSVCLSSREEWERFSRQCPGIGRGPLHPKAEIGRWLARRLKEGLIED